LYNEYAYTLSTEQTLHLLAVMLIKILGFKGRSRQILKAFSTFRLLELEFSNKYEQKCVWLIKINTIFSEQGDRYVLTKAKLPSKFNMTGKVRKKINLLKKWGKPL
jgi:hypothetical protein